MRQEISNQHHSGGDHNLQPLHRLLPLSNDLPMPSDILLLDAIPLPYSSYTNPRGSDMYPKRDHCGLDVCTWSPERSCRLDIGHPTNFSCMELEHESPNQDLSGAHFSPRSCVRMPISMLVPITNKLQWLYCNHHPHSIHLANRLRRRLSIQEHRRVHLVYSRTRHGHHSIVNGLPAPSLPSILLPLSTPRLQ